MAYIVHHSEFLFILYNTVIVGADKAGVRSARTRIDVLITSARRRMPFTHFLSFPVGDDIVRAKFEDFKQQVLHTCGRVRFLNECFCVCSFVNHLLALLCETLTVRTLVWRTLT